MAQKRHTQWMGWLPDLPDHRDHIYGANADEADLPASVDLRDQGPQSIYDQGSLGSCSANALAAAYEFNLIKLKKPEYTPSRLFIYYNERVFLGTEDEDSGAMLRDGIKTLAKEGAPDEALWPYKVNKFRIKPPADVYRAGQDHQALKYERIPRSTISMRACLSEGYPFVFGFSAYDEFAGRAAARTGVINLPTIDDEIWGGHAALVVGYDNKTKRFLCRNSWGQAWGQDGHFTIPFAYMTNNFLADDFWKISLVE